MKSAHPRTQSILFWGAMLAAFLIGVMLQYIIFERGFYSVSSDESGRTLDAWNWSQSKDFKPSVWLPLHTITLGVALDQWRDLFIVPRIISFFFGLVSLSGIAWLAHILFRNRAVTVVTMVLAAVFPARVILSVVPLSEIMFISVIVLAVALLARWMIRENGRDLLLAVALFALATTIRYEGWIVAVCVAAMLILRHIRGPLRLSARSIGIAVTVLLSFPLLWVLMHALREGDPFTFVRIPQENYTRMFGESWQALVVNSVPLQFILQNLTPLNLLGLIMVSIVLKSRSRLREWMMIPIAGFLLMSFASIAGKAMPNHSFWRVPAVWSVLLIPFTAAWVIEQRGWQKEGGRLAGAGVAGFLTALLIVQSILQTFAMTAYPDFRRQERSAGEYAASILNQSVRLSGADTGRILIESSTWRYLHVIIASQHPEVFLLNSGPDPSHPLPAILSATKPVDPDALRSANIRYVFAESAGLKKRLEHIPDLSHEHSFAEWNVYEVRPRPGGTSILAGNR